MKVKINVLDLCVTLYVATLQLFLPLDHGLDAIVHVLDQLHFGATEAPLVGDVVNAV